MTVQELFAEVREMMKRGTSLDPLFPSAFRNALWFIESNWNFNYMRKLGTVSVAQNDTSFLLPAAQSTGLKLIERVSWNNLQGELQLLKQVDVSEIDFGTTTDGWTPRWYYLEAGNRRGDGTLRPELYVDTPFKEAAVLSVYTLNRTVWNGDVTVSNLTILDYIPTLVSLRMAINLCVPARAPDLLQLLGTQWTESMHVALKADDDMVQANR